jgi:hypothetical protein
VTGVTNIRSYHYGGRIDTALTIARGVIFRAGSAYY